jgi:hypothetical protein
MKTVSKVIIAGLAIGLSSLVPQKAHAGVSVGIGFRFGSGHYCGPGYHSSVIYAPYRSCYYGPPAVYSYYPYYPTERVVVVNPPPSEPVVVQRSSPPPPQVVNSTYFTLGRDWARDIRDDVASRDQFVSYLKSNVTQTSTENYNEFRRGFISAYGVNGEAAFDKAYQQARGTVNS